MAKKITAGHVVAGLLGAGVSAALASRPTSARISDSNNKVKQMEARYDLKKAQLQTAAATTNDRNEEIRHLNELIATYESQVKELTSLVDGLTHQEMQMHADFGKQMQALQTESSDLKTQLSQKTQSVENLSQTNAQYQQELSVTKDKVTLLEAKVGELNTHHDSVHHPTTPLPPSADSYGMTPWFVSYMKGGGPNDEGTYVNGKFVNTPAAMISDRPERVRPYIPDYGQHGHPEFDGDWVRWGADGKPYRPTSLNDYR